MYEFILLDANRRDVAVFDEFTSLVWNRKLWDVGDFEIHVGMDLFSVLCGSKYLYCKSLDGLGVIERIGCDKETGRAWCAGRFAEKFFLDRVSFTGGDDDVAAINEYPVVAVKKMINENMISPSDPERGYVSMENVSSLIPDTSGEKLSYIRRGDALWDASVDLLRPLGAALRLEYDYLSNSFIPTIWKGLDRTDGQHENSLAIFSDADENIETVSFSQDSSEERNVAYVAGQGEGSERIILKTGSGSGYERFELWVDARDLQQGEGQSMGDYRAGLITRGSQKLEEYRSTTDLQGVIRQNGTLSYGVDYNLGDYATYQNSQIGIIVNEHITEILISVEAGVVSIEPSFGDQEKTAMQKIDRSVN